MRATRGALAASAILFTAVSSVLGLGGRVALSGNPGLVPEIVFRVWTASLAADAIFILGSMGTFLLAHRLASSGRAIESIVFSGAATYATYVASYLALPFYALFRASLPPVPGSPGDPLGFVLQWGIVGILAAAVLPWAFARQHEGARLPFPPGVAPPESDPPRDPAWAPQDPARPPQ
ncbi:MAG TPA: hypothetical protein VM681_06390 [Candidatus Thermoplasmatota archaeon]|nr:hypothetical protein [Candidatus Thermoplasmatota archaeon]